jgi:acyl-CoA synthetase (AMP-forming)/AMP-acid ligase II
MTLTALPGAKATYPVDENLDGLPASIPEILAHRRSTPDGEFVVGPDFVLTFAEAEAKSAALAGRLLAAGIGKGARIGILCANSPAWVVWWLAAARIGALTVPLSTFSPGRELSGVISHADVAALLTAPSFLDTDLTFRLEEGLDGLAGSQPELSLETAPYLRWIHVDDPRPPAWSKSLPTPLSRTMVSAAEQQVVPGDALVMINTSGSTAAPKSIVHTHGSLLRHAALLARLRGLQPSDRLYCPMPFFWVGGLTTSLLYALTSGCTLVTQERFEPSEALELMERHRVTLVQVWPNAARSLAEHPSFLQRDLSSVRGGTLPEAMPLGLRPETPDLYPGVFGMTETGGPHSNPDDPYHPLPSERRGTYGREVPGVARRVVDARTGAVLGPGEVGELCVRGPFVMDQIYKKERDAVFDPDGWYATGDLCSIDGDDLLRFHGRASSMIKTGGSNVAPSEVEEVLERHHGVGRTFVIGVPSERRGEEVVAAVVPLDGGALDPSDLDAFVRNYLSPYKVPRQWLFIGESELPLLASGKVDVPNLRGRFSA